MPVNMLETVLNRLNHSEMLVSRLHAGAVVSNLQQLAEVGMVSREAEKLSAERRNEQLAQGYGYDDFDRDKPFVFAEGTAVIPVHGTLMNRFNYSYSFGTGYNFIRAQMNAALDDSDVERIVFDINSHGGEAVGCFELAEEIREARNAKQLLAVVDAHCYSAAYAIGSAASPGGFIVTPSGGAGSIGVISMHIDVSKALKNMGVDVTIIAEDEHKADGNPYEPLPKEVLADIRASVAKRYGEFVDLVSVNRGLDSTAIRATQSRVYRADEALDLGLIDKVQSPSKAVADFLAEQGSDEPVEDGDETMTANAAANAAAATPAAAAPDAAALSAARSEGMTAERNRIAGIESCAAAATRPAAARACAMNTDMTVEQANSFLGALPEEKPAPNAATPAAANAEASGVQATQTGTTDATATPAATPAAQGSGALAAAMEAGGSPNVGADGGASGSAGGNGQPSRAQRAMAAAGFPSRDKAQSKATH